jgi:undecaprenyl-diphosphatase
MDIFQAVALGVVEGFTEFLPVSSTGHLILASDILRVPDSDFLKSFEVIIQLGAILAIVGIYRRTLMGNRDVLLRLLVAFLPSAAVGLTLYEFIKVNLLGNSLVVVWALFLGGIFLIWWEKYYEKKSLKENGNLGEKQIVHDEFLTKRGAIGDVSFRKVFLIGVFQALSVVPGVSRAGATIIGGMMTGLDRRAAVEFSFLLAVPTMAAATGLDLVKSNFDFSADEWSMLAVGFGGAFITAIFAVRYFVGFVERHTFVPFGIYRIVVSLLFWLIIVR